MKGKLTKRNKQFLSSRYKSSYNGNGSFQCMRVHKPFIDSSGNLQTRKPRYIWRWWLSTEHMVAIFGLGELSQSDQELGRYE